MEKNNEKLNEKYIELIRFFTELSKKSNDQKLAKFASNSVLDFVNELYKIEKKDKVIYEKMLEDAGVDKSKLVKIEKTEEYSDKKTDEFSNEKTEEKIENAENTEEKIEEKTGEKIEIDENTAAPTEEENQNKETNDNKKNDDKSNDNELANYVENNIENNPKLKEELDRLTKKISEDLKNPNDTLIDVWIKNYKDFVTKNNLDEKYMIMYLNNIFKLFDKDKKYSNIEEIYKNGGIAKDNVKDNTKTNEDATKSNDKTIEENKTKETLDSNYPNLGDKPNSTLTGGALKIISKKKPIFTRNEIIAYGVAAIAALSTPMVIPSAIIGFLGHRAYRKFKYKHFDLKNFLVEKGFALDDSNKLIDAKTKEVITEEYIGKVQYEEVKKELLNMGAMKGKINKDYKKNRNLAILMGLHPIKSLKDLQQKRKEKNENKYSAETINQILEEKDIVGGMRRL